MMRGSRKDQLLFLVVKLERPDLARTKSELIQQQNEFKVRLADLESYLLEKLAGAEGDILEDRNHALLAGKHRCDTNGHDS
ncbi:Dynein alpha chain, flagellar outer arm [Symbiodinium microadriaticum]|uniref:Dynein alpha chain, flagellar outer arm n=1 Tax=Symbiodinium microadriaticum TaxID=2951 RepID=A0A1Q9D659_SYMMI|nr:Dynein alpha chain, flagellar outer arm [Symbiodinium microadriaticum]